MGELKLEGGIKGVRGELRVSSDKSVSHRSLILGAAARGKTFVRNWLRSEDTFATLSILKALGTRVEERGDEVIVEGRNFVFEEPTAVLDAGNSGTTARIILGLLSTQPFFSVLTGDDSLRKRPMLRVVRPLREMGAHIDGRELGDRLPIAVRGGRLRGITFVNEKSSAQVKSALLLAGLRAEGTTQVKEPLPSRDHTERMLRAFGVRVNTVPWKGGVSISVEGGQELEGREIDCPADPSSAAFFCALCVLAPKGELLLKDTLVSPTRDAFFRKLREMGADISYLDRREVSGESVADILVRGGNRLRGTTVRPEEVPSLIDEIPILAVVMALSEGRSEVRGAGELRVKESDRIRAVVENLRVMGADVEELEDGFLIEGKEELRGASIRTWGDHRIAMAFAVAAMVAKGTTFLDRPECVSVSYPGFFKDLESVVER